MTPEQWLSEQIKEKGVKQKYIAQKTGISSQKISASLSGRRKIKTDEFISVCVVVGINPLDYPIPHAKGDANA